MNQKSSLLEVITTYRTDNRLNVGYFKFGAKLTFMDF